MPSSPISIEQALFNGTSDTFYYMVDPNKTFDENEDHQQNPIIGLNLINIEYENEPCSMILMKNWTENFRHQCSNTHYKF